MGHFRHHAIVVMSGDEKSIIRAHNKAVKVFPWVSAISPTVVNGYRSFFIPPDGSKERWERSDDGDTRRDEFIEWIEEAYLKSNFWATWCEVIVGGDEEPCVVRHG